MPTGTDIGLFNAGPYTFQPDLGSPYSVGAVWNTGSGSVTVTDNALTLNGCMVNGNSSIGIEMDPGGGALTFSNSLALGGPQPGSITQAVCSRRETWTLPLTR